MEVLVIAGSIFFGVVIAIVMRAIAEADRKRQALDSAPQNYNWAAPQITSWLPQCQTILGEEGRKGAAYEEGSACIRARAKSVELIEAALSPAELLYEEEITSGRYVAVEHLTVLRDACEDCETANRGEQHPRCLALTENQEMFVDLDFQEE